jgi:DNA-binding MarR family transcriptional regulator
MVSSAKQSKIFEIDIKETIPRVFVLFLQTAHAVEKYCDSELYFRAGLSMPKLAVLQILQNNGGTMMPSAIADLMLVARHNMTTLVDRLSKEGLVKVERGLYTDRRQVHVILTAKGRKALKTAAPVNQRIIKKVMADVDDNSATSLEQVLRILRLNAVDGLGQIYTKVKQPGE